jgi:hypothetical protein
MTLTRTITTRFAQLHIASLLLLEEQQNLSNQPLIGETAPGTTTINDSDNNMQVNFVEADHSHVNSI